MANEEHRQRLFDEFVTKLMDKRLDGLEKELSLVESADSIEEIGELLVEINSWISMICGENDELYERWRYHLILSPGGKAMVVQGADIDVNFRNWMKKPDE